MPQPPRPMSPQAMGETGLDPLRDHSSGGLQGQLGPALAASGAERRFVRRVRVSTMWFSK